MALAAQDNALDGLDGFRGTIYRAGDRGYDEARQIFNGMIEKHPALIARCQNTADVVAAVDLARTRSLEVSIRGGGHNVGGRSLTDGGLMIDLSAMKGIHVDPHARTARAQGGCVWGDLDRETQLHGLAVTGGGVSTTGISGLTLGGGFGWIMGKYGLTCDSLIAAEVVTADGRVIRASLDEHPDLLWALRGGGGNFGVVTSFEYRLYPVGPIVMAGLVMYPFARACEVLHFYREYSADVPDELTVFAALVHHPETKEKLVGLMLCHLGPDDRIEPDLAAIRALGTPALDRLGPMPYVELQQMQDAGFPHGGRNYWKSSFLRDLTDGAIDTLVEQFSQVPSTLTGVGLELFHGAVTREPEGGTAFAHRDRGINFLAVSLWLDRRDDGANVEWTRETFRRMSPFCAAGRYGNYLTEDEAGDDPVRAAYGISYDRLVQVKTAYDPTNMFHRNVNIAPAA